MTTFGIVTANLGGFDQVPPKPQGFDEAVLMTDTPGLSQWRSVLIPSCTNPRLAAKTPKMRPDLFLDTDVQVWMDACIREKHPGFLRRMAEEAMGSSISFFRHSSRESVIDEVSASLVLCKYRGQPLREQLESYLRDGFEDQFGLFIGTLIVRRDSVEVRDFGAMWLAHNLLWSTQDQVSLPYVLWRTKVDFGIIPQHYWRRDIWPSAHNWDDYSAPVSRVLGWPKKAWRRLLGRTSRNQV